MKTVIALGVFFFGIIVYATTTTTLPINTNPPTLDEVGAFLQSLPQIKDLGILGIIALAVQGLLLLARSKFIELDGKFKLIIITGLTWALGVITLKVMGSDWGSALVHSQSVAAFQVFFHQLYKQWFPKA